MRNSTVSVHGSSAVSEASTQITYMTRSKKSQSSSKNSGGDAFKNKKVISQRRGNNSSESSRTKVSAKNKLDNDYQTHEVVNQCIPSLPSKKLSKVPSTNAPSAHPAVPDQSVQNVKVKNATILEKRVRSRSKRDQNSKKDSHICNVCQKEFNSKTKLQRHATRHDPNKPYGCEICGKFFDDARYVKMHRTLHEKKSHKECDICGKVFNERIFFDIHRLTHFEQKPFRCDICEDIFKDRTTFMRHRNNHKARVRKVAQRFLSMKEVLKQKLEDSK